MQQCVNCGHQNRAGVVFCENCGASLIGKMPLDTKTLDSSTEEEKAQLGVDASILTDVKVQGMAEFSENASLRLEIEGSPEPILFKPKAETIFGRRDPATGAMPDVDLTPFAGYRMGVSRRHAAIRHNEDEGLDLWDLGSSNGTFINGERLGPHRPYKLHDGDEIRLGQMLIHVHFETEGKTQAKSNAKPVTGKLEIKADLTPAPETKAVDDVAAEIRASSAEAKKPDTGQKEDASNVDQPPAKPGTSPDKPTA